MKFIAYLTESDLNQCLTAFNKESFAAVSKKLIEKSHFEKLTTITNLLIEKNEVQLQIEMNENDEAWLMTPSTDADWEDAIVNHPHVFLPQDVLNAIHNDEERWTIRLVTSDIGFDIPATKLEV